MPRLLDSPAVPEFAAAFDAMTDRAAALFDPGQPLTVVGIRTRGETLADRLSERLKGRGFGDLRRGALDITLYRDDLSEIGPRPIIMPTDMTADIDGVPLLLVDDVLHTGRSVRAALTELADLGRPSVVRLAVLVDRGGRELPVAPDVVGVSVETAGRVNVRTVEDDGADGIEIEGAA